MTTEAKVKNQASRKKAKKPSPVFTVLCTLPDNLEETKKYKSWDKAFEWAIDLEASIVKKDGKTIFRRATLVSDAPKRALIDAEGRASRLRREANAKRHAELIQAEKECIMEAIERTVFGGKYYGSLREVQLEAGTRVSMNITVVLDTDHHRTDATVSGSVPYKAKGSATYADPNQPGLFDDMDD